jgi:hypothetical protein
VAASDQAGSLVWLEAYRPWGERYLADDAGTKNGIWYAGKPVEDATGLAYLGARWYSAEVGRALGKSGLRCSLKTSRHFEPICSPLSRPSAK